MNKKHLLNQLLNTTPDKWNGLINEFEKEIQKEFIDKLWNELIVEKFSCSWNEEPHTFVECPQAGDALKLYLIDLKEEYD